VQTESDRLVVIVPALNEETHIESAIRELLPVLRRAPITFQMVAVNDGSSDRTGAIMDELATAISELTVIHHDQRRGLGASFAEVLYTTNARYITLIPGDNAYRADSLDAFFGAIGQCDLVVAYRDNQSQRTLQRRLSSAALTKSLNLLFRSSLRDYHGITIFPVERLRADGLVLQGYTFHDEALITLIRAKCSFVQVPVSLNPEISGRSRAFNFAVATEMAGTALRLFLSTRKRKKRSESV
jgi:dolichol-phosphate mannosyltransferase